MISKANIPEYAICRVCGEPMKVIDLKELAEQKGLRVPAGDSFVIGCCKVELTIDDDDEFRELCRLLIAYHKGVPNT